MKISVPNQSQANETRVSITPAVAKRLVGLGVQVQAESGAGLAAGSDDSAYQQAGATILADPGSAWGQGDMIATLLPPTLQQAQAVPRGSVVIGMLAPLRHPRVIATLAQGGVTAFSLEFLPRTSRAQPMDALSSQANVSGYVAAILAAGACSKMFPMMITAAGTVTPAKVFVIGAGVAGLQAIATAKRLGAVVEAYDVRPAVKEQVQSVGGRFVELPQAATDTQTAGGYAREQTDEERQRQIDLMARHVTAADAVIATAAVFGKAPPLLIPQAVVDQMKPGSVIVDLAADEQAGRGNCEATRPGQRYTTPGGVVIEGATNLPGRVPAHSSLLYANNLFAFIKEILGPDGRLTLNLDDELQKNTLMTHDGRAVHPLMEESLKKNR